MADASGTGPDWPVALLELDRERGEVVQANAAARRLLAWERQGVVEPRTWPRWLWGQDVAPPGWDTLAELVVRTPSGSSQTRAWPRLIDGQPRMWQVSVQVDGPSVRLVCLDAQAAADDAAPSARAQLAQRDVLVREVHHRLKNNLQGVSGLLRHQAANNPAAAASLEAAATQLQAMAQVYGLPMAGGRAPELAELVSAVARAAGSVFGVEPELIISRGDPLADAVGEAAEAAGPRTASASDSPPSDHHWRDTLWAHLEASPSPPAHILWPVHPDQAGGLALVLNELMTNALKHGMPTASGLQGASSGALPEGGPAHPRLRCEVRPSGDGALVDILNPGHWPNRPRLEDLPPGVVGLSLVKALLPTRGVRLEFRSDAALVCARLHIQAPVLLTVAQSRPQFPDGDRLPPRS